MISYLQFMNHYPTRLPGVRKHRIEFGPRFNLLCGPNGAGKTTILRTIAMKTGAFPGGWSDRREPTEPDFDAEIGWDGLPVFYQDCYAQSEKPLINPNFFLEHRTLRSTGEKRIGLINEMINDIEGRFPTFRLGMHEHPTLLLDEPDNHIGFAGQSILWKELFPRLARKYQLVVSSHSIMPILLQKQNLLREDIIIQLHSGYIDACIKELAAAIDHYNTNVEPDSSR